MAAVSLFLRRMGLRREGAGFPLALQDIIERDDEPYCLRLQKNRVFYVR